MADHIPLHIGTQIVGRHRSNELVGSSHEGRLADNDFLDKLTPDALSVGILLKQEMRVGLLEFAERHFVVVGLRIAKLGTALGDKRQRGLKAEDSIALGFGLLVRESEKTEHAGNMFLVGFPDLDRCLVVVQVVILLSERQSTLTDIENVHSHIFLISTKAIAIRHSIAEDPVFELHTAQVVLRTGCFYFVEEWLHRCDALLIAASRVHGQLVEVGQLALRRTLGKLLLVEFVKDGVDALVVVLLQLVKAAEARIGSRQRIVLLPSARCKLIEILGRLSRLVKVFHFQSRLVLGETCHGGSRHQNHGK